MNNFLITGMGCSGTRRLQKLMNISHKWQVRHETKGDYKYTKTIPNKRNLMQVQKRFEKEEENYGEVNWRLLLLSEYLHVKKMGLIIRNPIEIWLSFCNERKGAPIGHMISYRYFFCKLANLAESGSYQIISFARSITEKQYLTNLFFEFDIDDVDISDELFTRKWNYTREHIFKSINDFDEPVKREVLAWKSIVERWL